jgi:hypothetical protein
MGYDGSEERYLHSQVLVGLKDHYWRSKLIKMSPNSRDTIFYMLVRVEVVVQAAVPSCLHEYVVLYCAVQG